MEVRDRIRMEEAGDDDHRDDQIGDVSFATTTDCRSVTSGEEMGYKIHDRRMRAVPHTSAICHAMMRKIRPARKTRPRPPAVNQNVTGRSNARRSNFSNPSSDHVHDPTSPSVSEAQNVEEEVEASRLAGSDGHASPL